MNAKAFLCRLRKTAIPLLILAGCASLLAGAAAERTLRYVSEGGNSIIADFTKNSSSSFNPFALDATISTDKADYAPGEIVQISGGGFLPGETVQLQVVHIEKTTTSVTSLADHQGHDPWFVGADSSGNVSSSWLVQEDSINQTLLLTADGLSSGLHAEAIFTDAPAKITLEQCHNFDGALVDCTDAAGPTNYWGSGNAQQNNARLAEGDNQNFRAIMSGIAAGSQTLVIELDLTKGGKVAYDRYSSPARIRTATHSTGTQKAGPGVTPESLGIFPCINNGDVDAFCTPGTGVPVQIPLIPAGIIPAGNFDVDVRNSQNADIPEHMFIYGDATLNLASATYSFSGSIDGDSSLRLSIPFTKTVGTGDLVLAWGGHVSKSEDYETSGKTTAVTIEGSPYHMRLISFTGIQGDTGNQDMQMASTAIAAPVGTITIIKDAVPNDAQDFAFTADNGLTPASFSLDDDGDATLPSQIDFTDVAIGTYNIAETLGTPDWVLTGLNCVDPNGGTTFSTITGIATIDISEGETVVCTFTNTKQTAELEVTKTPDNTEVCEGSTVTYTYVVTNTGTAELTNVNLDDDVLGDIDGGSGITLAPGASQQFTKDGVINGVVHNTVTATGDTAGGQNAQATADATVTGVVCTISVTKVPRQTEVCNGTSVTYDITVTNNSPTFAWTGDVVDDILGTLEAGVTIPAAGSKSYTPSGSINGEVTNTVTADGAFDDPASSSASANANATVTGFICTISVTKVPRQTEVCNGTSVTYDITVTNNSPTFAWTGDVSDDILGVLGTGVVIAAGGSTSFTPSHNVTGEVTNTVTADGAFDDPASSSASANANATVTGFICSISVTKVPRQTEVCNGTSVTYDITVTNNSPTFAWTGDVSDDILGVLGTGVVIAAGGSTSFTPSHNVTGEVTNTVTADGAFDDPASSSASANANATVTGFICSISVTKVPRQTEVCNGTSVTYDITVTNNSPTFAWTGDVSDDILGVLGTGVVIAAGGSTSFTPSHNVTGEVTNTVTANGAFDDPASSSASANANATVTGFVCSISLTKTPSAENVCNGATVTYEYVATNNSPQFTWTGNLTDDQLGTISDPLVLAPGASQTFNASSPIVGTVVNTATATGTFDDGSGSSANASATATVNGSTCRIRVLKVTDPLGSPEEFAFTGDLSGSLKDGDPALSADVLAPGTYSTSETVPAGWDLTSISCNDANSTGSATPKAPGETGTATYQLELGETVTCTFTNTERGTVSITKTLLGGPIPFGESFTFQLRQGASTLSDGTVLDTKVVDSTTVFPLQLNGSLVPGNYQVCEFILPGWDSTIRTMTGAFVPNSLSDPANTDNAYVCAPITIDPGEDESISIDNSPPPGGMAKTIGFWKNWTSCDGNGNQDPILDETLALFPENSDTGTHGVFIGLLFVDTCEEAVTVLDKRVLAPIGSKGRTKFANNSAVSMAAQLLAARLNIRAGADPSCIGPVIDLAQAYLEDVNYDGTGTDNISKVNAETINFLAGLLDAYNNNVLSCPLPSLPPAP